MALRILGSDSGELPADLGPQEPLTGQEDEKGLHRTSKHSPNLQVNRQTLGPTGPSCEVAFSLLQGAKRKDCTRIEVCSTNKKSPPKPQ